MKRSEALKLIEDILAIERSRMLWAEKILLALEEAGMLPPENDGSNCSDPVISLSKEYFDEYVPSRIVIGWEKE